MRKFKSLDSKKLRDGRTVHSVEADQDLERGKTGLVGEWVLLDGIPKKVKGIETHPKTTNIRKGEIIGLTV